MPIFGGMQAPDGMGPPPPRPAGIAGPAGLDPQQAQQMAQAMQQRKLAAAQASTQFDPNAPKGPPPPGGGQMPPDVAQRFQAAQAQRGMRAPPPGGIPGGGGAFSQALGGGRPPPPGGGLQAAGFAPRPGMPAGQFAGRFPGAQTPGAPQFGGGTAFNMQQRPQGGGMFGAQTKGPTMTGQASPFGGMQMRSMFGSQR